MQRLLSVAPRLPPAIVSHRPTPLRTFSKSPVTWERPLEDEDDEDSREGNSGVEITYKEFKKKVSLLLRPPLIISSATSSPFL